MTNKFSKKNYNRNSITVKTNSIYTTDAFNNFKYNEKATELTHDTLQVLLNSPNPLRTEYNFNDNDFELIAQFVAKQKQLINECAYFLQKCKEF